MLARLEHAWPGAVVVGCSARSVIGGGREVEDHSSLALVATLPGVELAPFELDDPERAAELAIPADAARILLADPFSFDTERALAALGGAVVGGLASGGTSPGQHSLFVGGRVRRTGCVGVALSGAVEVVSSVAQGCRRSASRCS